MTPEEAVHLIKMALSEESWDICVFAQIHQGDHKTDDTDPSLPYNRKTDGYTAIGQLVRRLQEAKLGDIKFRNGENHFRKTHMEGDWVRRMQQFRELRARRHKATRKYASTINVDDLLEFTQPLRELGVNFNYKEFLYAVLPYWEDRARDLTPPARAITSPLMVQLTERVNFLVSGCDDEDST